MINSTGNEPVREDSQLLTSDYFWDASSSFSVPYSSLEHAMTENGIQI